MIKFEIKKNEREISYKNRSEIKVGCTLEQDNQEPAVIKSFDSKEEALKALKGHKTDIRELSGGTGKNSYFTVIEYYVEENEYDEDDEWISGGDVLGVSKMNIELVEKPSYTTIGVFDNYADAEKAYSDYKGEDEVYISF